jgi:hypothetical protein
MQSVHKSNEKHIKESTSSTNILNGTWGNSLSSLLETEQYVINRTVSTTSTPLPDHRNSSYTCVLSLLSHSIQELYCSGIGSKKILRIETDKSKCLKIIQQNSYMHLRFLSCRTYKVTPIYPTKF